jgi:hypothetical protein
LSSVLPRALKGEALSRTLGSIAAMPEQSETERLRAVQARRARQESEDAERASDEEERHAHERRADKAAYLRDKLADQAKAPDV